MFFRTLVRCGVARHCRRSGRRPTSRYRCPAHEAPRHARVFELPPRLPFQRRRREWPSRPTDGSRSGPSSNRSPLPSAPRQEEWICWLTLKPPGKAEIAAEHKRCALAAPREPDARSTGGRSFAPADGCLCAFVAILLGAAANMLVDDYVRGVDIREHEMGACVAREGGSWPNGTRATV